MLKTIKIGTRSSELALWQAYNIQNLLIEKGFKTEIVKIKSEGEQNLTSPLYEMGIQGIFTKTLDIALLENRIDIAVHSLKDVPTKLPKGLIIAATPKRGNYKDCLVFKSENDLPENAENYTIATSSLRRKAQWLNRFPSHKTESIRGNINSRLDKLINNKTWNGALLAKAGIERIDLKVPFLVELDWMLPAPSQGALGIACRENDLEIREICNSINDKETEICVNAERQMLNTLNGGCTMPIACLAVLENDELFIKANILTIDGKSKSEISAIFKSNEFEIAGKLIGEKLLKAGAKEIMDTFR